MKKLYVLLIFVCLFSVFAIMLTSCGQRLRTPTSLYLDEDTQTLKWNRVRGAQGYTVKIPELDFEATTQANYYSLEWLNPGEYTVRVFANGDGKNSRTSAAAKYEFERLPESGLKYQLINNGTEYALVGGGTASGDVVMEDEYRGKPVTAIADKALYHNAKITSITIGKNVKSIGVKAFTKCSKLTEIVIPENVTSIGEYAFQSCKALVKVTLPDSVTVIAPYTFAWCSSLAEIKLGKDLTVINEFAFSNCEKLTTISHNGVERAEGRVQMPDTLLGVANYAFADCLSITDITFGDSLQAIGTYAFSGNTSLASLDLGEGVLSIQDGAFYGCTSLTSAAIPDSCQVLGNGIFYGCTLLAEASFGTGLTNVGSQIFSNTALYESATNMLIVNGWLIQVKQTNIQNISFNNEIVGIASYAFSGCNELQNATFKGVKYVGAAAFSSLQKLYLVSFDNALLEIGDYAFAASTVTNLHLGNSLTYIGNYAFQGCKLLTKDTMKNFTLPETLTYIGARAFRNTGLYTTAKKGSVVYVGNWAVDYVESDTASSIVLNTGVRGIAAYTFSNQKLTLMSMPDSVEYICRSAFYKCSVSRVHLSAGLKVIDDYAFYGCNGTNFDREDFALIIPEGTTYIGRSAFYECQYILGLSVPGTVEYIGPYAFYGCDSIGATVDVQVQKPTGEKDEDGKDKYEVIVNTVTGYITFGDGLKYIEERAFQNCLSIVSVNIPDSVVYVGPRAFYKCTALESVTLGSGMTFISDYTFYKCTALKEVRTSNNLEIVGNYAFRGCEMLESFEFNSVKQLGRYSFYGCKSLKSISIPTTLVSIGDYAFRGCSAVKSVVLPETLEVVGKHAFYNLNEATFYAAPDKIKPYWNNRFNSSYRPIFFGCELSEDGSHVVSVTVAKNNPVNPGAKNGISDPEWEGHTFLGWATSKDSSSIAYTSENVASASSGTVLYAVWVENSQPNE